MATTSSKEQITTKAPKKEKKKLTQEEIRQLRKRRKAKREKKVLENDTTRIDYIQNRVTKDELHKKEQQNKSKSQSPPQPTNSTQYMNHNNTQNIRDAFNHPTNNPFMNPNMQHMFPGMGMGPMGANPFLNSNANNSTGSLDPNIEINDMMNSMLNALGGNTDIHQTSEQRIAKQKHEETVERYSSYSHTLFCILFVLLLVFLPYQYDITIFHYNLSSDAWTYFISFEIILFSLFYGYKQYLQRKYASQNQTANNIGMNGGVGGAGQLMTMLGGNLGASFFGGGNEMSRMIQRWINRAMMVWSYIKMLRQLLSDLCLILFLWIILTSIKTLFGG